MVIFLETPQCSYDFTDAMHEWHASRLAVFGNLARQKEVIISNVSPLQAARCIQSGVDIPTVAKWLGHSDSGALLLKTYCHLIDEHTAEMAKRVKVGSMPPLLEYEADNVIALTQPAEGTIAGACDSGTLTTSTAPIDAVPVSVPG